MYPSLRNLFVQVLNHQSRDVLADSRTDAGVRPDIAVAARIENDLIIPNWIVVEAKDEAVFQDNSAAGRIMRSKWRYVTAGTEWFVCIDPATIRIRRISRTETVDQEQPDQVFSLDAPINVDLEHALEEMAFESLENRSRLRDFRMGKPGTFGRIRIEADESRRIFLDALNTAARHLSSGVGFALKAVAADRSAIRGEWNAFREQFPSAAISLNPFRVTGTASVHIEDRVRFRRAVSRLRESYRQSPVAFQLEITVSDAYRTRSKDEKQAEDLLREETAALLLSRILMLRFFEDYGYFGERRYLCNGGIAAFQAMREYMAAQYPEWLRRAY